jgi:hypothetical protein
VGRRQIMGKCLFNVRGGFLLISNERI